MASMKRILIATLAAFTLLLAPAASARGPAGSDTAEVVTPSQLPPEARATLALIRKGGPFPYAQDNTTFGNRERILRSQPRGYYREYTVVTPGLKHRGARRIVAGGNPPQEFFYTEDHYRSFRRIQE
jgi:ribonuclease T1